MAERPSGEDDSISVPLPRAEPWSPTQVAGILLLVAAGIAVRVVMWPARGFAPDLDLFARWIHGIATGGLPGAYKQDLPFPAVMAWLWGALAAIQPAFRSVSDSADPAIRTLMKVPGSLADLGLAAGALWWHRRRPSAALWAAGGMLVIPGVWYVSAWWGQYESIYVLPALLAVVAARANRASLASGLLAVALMTKPQAFPLLIPFCAWLVGSGGWRGLFRGAAVAAAVGVVLWLPFLPQGPVDYLRNVAAYQEGTFRMLSLNAWNPWFLVQQAVAGGAFVFDGTSVLGPVTFRALGYGAAAALAIPVFEAVRRNPTGDRLALAFAAISLTTFVALTTMHERYAYAGFVLLALSIGRPRILAAWLLLGVVYSLNLLVFLPPEGWAVNSLGPVSTLGSGLMIALAAFVFLETLEGVRWRRQDAVPGMPGLA